MFGLSSKINARRRAWRLAVGAAAGMTMRDHGGGAYFNARSQARQALDEGHAEAHRFWTAVAAEIIARGSAEGAASD